MKNTAQSYGYLCIGLHLGYAQTDKGTWQRIVYLNQGSLAIYPCDESDVDKSKVFDERILTASEKEVFEILANSNFVQMWQIHGQDALVEATLDTFLKALEKDKSTDPRLPLCIISGVMIGYWFDNEAKNFCRIFYENNRLFSLPCRKDEVDTRCFLSKSFSKHAGTEKLRKNLAALDFIDERVLILHDMDAEIFQNHYHNKK